jgi:hypothetical protein
LPKEKKPKKAGMKFKASLKRLKPDMLNNVIREPVRCVPGNGVEIYFPSEYLQLATERGERTPNGGASCGACF